MASVEDFLEMFNNGDLDVQKYFGGYDVWFSLLKKRGLMGEIDPHNASDNEVWQNEYLLWLYENETDNYYFWIQKLLDDIVVENGVVYFQGEREDLARFFCDGHRYDLSRDTIEKILSDGGDVWDPYWDTTDDVYRDVIEELTPENDKILQEYVFNSLKDQQIEPETEELELIASEQDHPEYALITPENVKRVIDDKETMEFFFENGLEDLKSELYSIHSSAYNSAYEDDVYEEIYSELGKYLDMNKGEWISVQHPYKKDTQIQKFRAPIHNFESWINEYLENNKGYGNTGTLEYHGSFVGTISEDQDCLHAQVPDYPDFRKVDKNINSYFKDQF
jgi:hypothetical protein